MQPSLVVIKLSGSILNQENSLTLLPHFVQGFLDDGFRPILVHGAGKQVDLACKEKNIPIHKIDGRRITSLEIRDIMLELVHGKLNRKITELLLTNGIPALGMTTGDAQILTFKKRSPTKINDNLIDFGFVGDLQSVQKEILLKLTELTVPVFSCLGFSPKDGWLNVNADTITSIIAVAIKAKKVVMASELAGVKNKTGEFLNQLSPSEIKSGIKDGWITDGMIVKLEQASELANSGISVQIGTLNGFQNQIFTEITNS